MPESEKNVVQDFLRRRRFQITATKCFCIFEGVMMLAALWIEYERKEALGTDSYFNDPGLLNTLGWIVISLVVGAGVGQIVFTQYNWRCPRCNRFLGLRSLNPTVCRKCCTPLR